MKEQKGTSHKDQIHRLNRIAGQVGGLVGMIEEERYCIDILTQIKAIKSALGNVERKIIEDHIGHCISAAVKAKDEKTAQKMLQEISDTLKSTGATR